MSTSINKGRRIHVWNFSVDASTGSTITLNQQVNALIIQCRTAVDLQFRESQGDSAYFTIKSGTVLHLDYNTPNLQPFHLLSGTGTVNVEIIGLEE